MNISDLSCRGYKGNEIHGTAAILHRIFENAEKAEIEDERQEDIARYNNLIEELGYARTSDK